jgi:hypothetical protein
LTANYKKQIAANELLEMNSHKNPYLGIYPKDDLLGSFLPFDENVKSN